MKNKDKKIQLSEIDQEKLLKSERTTADE